MKLFVIWYSRPSSDPDEPDEIASAEGVVSTAQEVIDASGFTEEFGWQIDRIQEFSR